MTEAVHAHGALAGVELWHGGARSANLNTRLVPMDVASLPNATASPMQTRAMDKTDIRNLRRWHRKAALAGARCGVRHRLCLRHAPICCPTSWTRA
jgi:dimethylamine/trimethylamine dehydrogenase